MYTEVVKGNISSRDSFRLECQKCKCKKVRLLVDRRSNNWDSNDYYFSCNHCGNKQYILWGIKIYKQIKIKSIDKS